MRKNFRVLGTVFALALAVTAGCAATGVPQVVQNFAPSRSSELQFWHFIVVVLFS